MADLPGPMTKWIVVVAEVYEGADEVYGPFDTEAEAEAFRVKVSKIKIKYDLSFDSPNCGGRYADVWAISRTLPKY